MTIHPTALVDPEAVLGDVEVGPFAVIGAGVELADGVVIGSHCVLEGPCTIGPRTVLESHVVLGGPPQDRSHDPGDRTALHIGADNVFRAFCTVHRGSSSGRGLTRIGDGGYFMTNSHVAHDCCIGDGVVFTNGAVVGGHVEVGDGAVLAGLCAVHQHVRVGRLAMVGGGAMCAQDVPPFSLVQGDRARLCGLNAVGLRRAGFDRSTLGALKRAWRLLFAGGLPRKVALARVEEEHGAVPEVQELVAFLRTTRRGICRARVP